MVEYIKIAVFFSIGVYIYERIDIAFALIFLFVPYNGIDSCVGF